MPDILIHFRAPGLKYSVSLELCEVSVTLECLFHFVFLAVFQCSFKHAHTHDTDMTPPTKTVYKEIHQVLIFHTHGAELQSTILVSLAKVRSYFEKGA